MISLSTALGGRERIYHHPRRRVPPQKSSPARSTKPYPQPTSTTTSTKDGWLGLRRHDLRHAGATWFANAGVPLHIVRDILGHASIETTKSYLHTDTTELTLAAERTNQHLKWTGAPSYTT